MARLTLIRGLPGSGKSTLAESLIRGGYADVCFENDDYFLTDDGHYRYDPLYTKEAIAHCFSRTKDALANGERVIVANTFSVRAYAEPYLWLVAPEDVQILMCFGTYQNIHNVPDERIAEMRRKWEFF